MLNNVIAGKPRHIFSPVPRDKTFPCLIVDMSKCGAAILLPKNIELPAEKFNLVIDPSSFMQCNEIHVTAELRWVNDDYSCRYRKIGLEFVEVNNRQKKVIVLFNQSMKSSDYPRIPCNISVL